MAIRLKSAPRGSPGNLPIAGRFAARSPLRRSYVSRQMLATVLAAGALLLLFTLVLGNSRPQEDEGPSGLGGAPTTAAAYLPCWPLC